jgi:hypothetical protein
MIEERAMSKRRLVRSVTAVRGTAALLPCSTVGALAQVVPGTINLPILGSSDGPFPVSDLMALNSALTITSDNFNGVFVPCRSNEPDNPPEVDLVGCGGSFNFTSVTCVGLSDPEPDLPAVGTPETGLCSIGANGNFQNLVCGTGYVQGNTTVTGGADAGEAGTFGIVFTATVGVVTGYISGDYVVGVVQLGPPLAVPRPPNPNDPDCTGGFTVHATAVLLDL